MKLYTLKHGGKETAAVKTSEGLVPLETVNLAEGADWSVDMQTLIERGQVGPLNDWYRNGGRDRLEQLDSIAFDKAVYAPLIRRPAKIFGIGLNYAAHAKDLHEKTPTGYPGSFFKPYTTIIGPGDNVELPLQSELCDGEGELAIVMGKEGHDISEDNWLNYVAGFTVSTDMTALDILALNTRFLTLAKSFGTFFGLSSELVTPDEINDVMELKVRTVLNGEVFAEDYVHNMTFPPNYLVSSLSKIMTWLPGDIISTGTPRGVHIKDGDVIEGQVDGFESISHRVIDKKLASKA